MTIWITILGLIVTTVAIKAFGPVLFGGRELPAAFARVVACMPAALLTALVLVAMVADGQRLAVGAQTAGVAVAGVLLWLRHSLVLAAAVAVVVTAALRALA